MKNRVWLFTAILLDLVIFLVAACCIATLILSVASEGGV
jgi:hypothetical protein